METLLREYVTLLFEKIRSKSFDLARFKTLEDPASAKRYATQHLKTLGRGSSRHVFLLNSRQVLKIAMGPKGLAQNEAEVEAFTDPKIKRVISKIYDAHPGYFWLISELVRPFHGSGEFEKLTGMNWYNFVREAGGASSPKDTKATQPHSQRARSMRREDDDEAVNEQLVAAASQLLHSKNMLADDMFYIGHWGKTSDGHVVLYDYGATQEVFDTHYKR